MVPVLTSAPTREFRRQHDVEAPRVDERAFRQGWRVRTRLDQLLADDRISRSEWQAAVEYRAAWGSARELTAVVGPGTLRVQGNAVDGDAATICRLEAAMKLRVVEAAIGTFAASLARCCVVHDMTWAATARHCQRNPETIRDWTVFAIRALARAWDVPQRRQRKARPIGRANAGTPVRAS